MGTNYYLRNQRKVQEAKEKMKKCIDENDFYTLEELIHSCDIDGYHIGKTSYGWKFLFCNKDIPVNNKTEMFNYLKESLENGSYIENEYGEQLSLDEFVTIVENSMNNQNGHKPYDIYSYYKEHNDEMRYYIQDSEIIDEDGYRFSNNEFC